MFHSVVDVFVVKVDVRHYEIYDWGDMKFSWTLNIAWITLRYEATDSFYMRLARFILGDFIVTINPGSLLLSILYCHNSIREVYWSKSSSK